MSSHSHMSRRHDYEKIITSGLSINNYTLEPRNAIVTGWVFDANTRGTSDIIFGSFLTIFLCTWTAICLNIPNPNDSKVQILKRKAKWMLWAIVAPELVLAVAIGQYASARRSVARFRKLGHSSWTLRHAFFADMGGILLKPRDSTAFVVNSRQLAYLVEHKYTDGPAISEEDIWDRSKADTMTKIISLAQASWLGIQLCGRAIQRLPTTTLELSAGAIVLCTFGTFFCWLHKPSDLNSGITLEIEASTADILLKAGDAAAEPYRHTPLDFVAKQSFTCGYDVLGFFGMRCDDLERPLRRFPNDRFPDISTFEKFALFCLTLAYSACHLFGWNFFFPTSGERVLWQVSSMVITVTTFLFWVFETVAARQRYGRWDKYLIFLRLKEPPTSIDAEKKVALDPMDAFEIEQKCAKPMLKWEVWLILPVILVYVAARSYMIVEVFVSLRTLPIGAYQTVQVVQMLPHL